MKTYKINFSNGTAWLTTRIIRVEDWEAEQDAIDKMIDELEEEGYDGYFIDIDEIVANGGDIEEDEYIIGGNHGRLLYHGGYLTIELVE